MNICEFLRYYLKMNSPNRIKLSLNPVLGNRNHRHEEIVSLKSIEFHSG